MNGQGSFDLPTLKPLALLLTATMLMTGCSRKNNPILSTPSSGVSGLSMSIPQIDGSGAPDDRIFLSVRDNSNNPLTDFQLGNFSILEGGVPGVPYEVGKVNDPLFLALVIDRSGSMAITTDSAVTRNAAASAAAVALINALGATDNAALIEFDDQVQLKVDFTTDKSSLVNAINAGVPGGATAVYDAVNAGAQLLNGKPGRRLLLVLTDGEDNSSSSTLAECVEKVNNGGLSAFTVGLGLDAATNSTGVQALQQIASSTGGTYYNSSDGSDLTSVFLNILDRMNSLVYVKYRRRSKGEITVYVNYGPYTANAKKSF